MDIFMFECAIRWLIVCVVIVFDVCCMPELAGEPLPMLFCIALFVICAAAGMLNAAKVAIAIILNPFIRLPLQFRIL